MYSNEMLQRYPHETPGYRIDTFTLEGQKWLEEDYNKGGSSSYKLTCQHCDYVFYAKRPDAKWCSYRCRNDAYIIQRKERREQQRFKTCVVCKIEFKAKRKDAKYCSPACRQKEHRTKKQYVTDVGCAELC